MNVISLRKAIKKGNYEWRKHTLIRLAERVLLTQNPM